MEDRTNFYVAIAVIVALIAILLVFVILTLKSKNRPFLGVFGSCLRPTVPSRENLSDRHDHREKFSEEGSFPWKRIERIEKIQSLFHKIEVIDMKDENLGTCLYVDDEVQLCSSEKAKYYELLVHFPMQYLDFERDFSVLIVGGGDSMALQEVAKYKNAKRIVIVELDDMITRMCEKYFEVDRLNDDPRVHWIYSNVTRTIGSLLEKADEFDLILVDTTLQSDAINENKEFYTNLSRLMTRRGIIVKNGEKSEFFMKSALPWTLNYGFTSKTAETRSTFVVGNTWFDFRDYRLRADAWNRLGIKTEVYDPDHHYEYLRWTDLVTKSQLERIGADQPDKYRPYYNAKNEDQSRTLHPQTLQTLHSKPKEKSLDEILGREKSVNVKVEYLENRESREKDRETRDDRESREKVRESRDEDRESRNDIESRDEDRKKVRESRDDRESRDEDRKKVRESRDDRDSRDDDESHDDDSESRDGDNEKFENREKFKKNRKSLRRQSKY